MTLLTLFADDTIYLQIVPITQSGTPDKVSPWATPRASVGGKPWNGDGSHANNSYAESIVSGEEVQIVYTLLIITVTL